MVKFRFETLTLILGLMGVAHWGYAQNDFPVPDQDPDDTSSGLTDYVLEKGDRLRVEIYLQPDLHTTVSIDSTGMIRLPLVEELSVAGLTVGRAQQVIEAAFRDQEFLRNPHASIEIIAHVSRQVVVTGQVRNPGGYPVPLGGTMNLLDLLVQAGGFTEVARGNAVVITRADAAGNKTSHTIEAANLLRGEGDKASPELMLKPGDIVFVPERIF